MAKQTKHNAKNYTTQTEGLNYKQKLTVNQGTANDRKGWGGGKNYIARSKRKR